MVSQHCYGLPAGRKLNILDFMTVFVEFSCFCIYIYIYIYTDPEARVRFPALPEK
jgi:hypothetical protein